MHSVVTWFDAMVRWVVACVAQERGLSETWCRRVMEEIEVSIDCGHLRLRYRDVDSWGPETDWRDDSEVRGAIGSLAQRLSELVGELG